jgi:hypothetical protein
MPFRSRPLALAGVRALGATVVGCSYEHGPLSDTPDTTSLGTAGRWGAPYISTATGVRWRPSDPNAVLPGTVQGESSMLTTQVQPPRTLYGTREDWTLGRPSATRRGRRWVWISGPNLPVEAWNMALETAPGEAAGEGHGGAKAHPN